MFENFRLTLEIRSCRFWDKKRGELRGMSPLYVGIERILQRMTELTYPKEKIEKSRGLSLLQLCSFVII